MSEEKKELQTYVTYDTISVIKDIELSASYIPALQNIVSNLIMADDKVDTIGETFKKFDIIAQKSKDGIPEDEADLPVISKWEADLYVLFSLTQSLKYKAQKQGLEIKTETSATKEEMQALAKDAFDGKNVAEKLKDIESKMRIVK